jgi:hypothetical protein
MNNLYNFHDLHDLIDKLCMEHKFNLKTLIYSNKDSSIVQINFYSTGTYKLKHKLSINTTDIKYNDKFAVKSNSDFGNALHNILLNNLTK